MNHSCIVVIITSPCRWPEYRPIHVGENILNKIRHRMVKCICWLFISIFLDIINARKTEHIKLLICQSVDVHHESHTCWREGKDTKILTKLILFL